ncbi:Uma2 family endonuclease [Gloeobacter violaceus]|uniref:Glr0136 protein n=1 Tax=Gloeobacter violaceus (strain ATCC 29082 / PCC 7421) TaxID=251221 RepID=Q7NPB9_GLOVI|nr:Uma2 family endonuclease [Gloeobacter violaceus]BAC88077.1 glr0136 [Gloeobacter violaceus PCC 7421]
MLTAALLQTGEQRIWLEGISWETFERLLDELGESRAIRLAYDQGVLEIMSPLNIHEKIKKLIARFIEAWADEMDIAVEGIGSWTMRRPDLARAIEPDECYYIAHQSEILGVERIDLQVSPPPDLAVEVDVSSSSRVRLAIYRRLGIPEVWTWRGQGLIVQHLIDGEYVEADHSRVLPGFAVQQLSSLVLQGLEIGQSAAVREFKQQIRTRANP